MSANLFDYFRIPQQEGAGGLRLTEIVNDEEEGCTQHGTEPRRAPDVAVEENARRDGSILLLPPLDGEESTDQENEQDKKRNDARATPRVLATTPLEGKQQADDGRQEARSTGKIKLLELLFPRSLDLGAAALDVEEGDDESCSHGTERKVDVEAPAPPEPVSELTIFFFLLQKKCRIGVCSSLTKDDR